MKRKLTRGSTGVVVPVLLQDTSRTDGSGLTGVTYDSPGLVARWKRSDQTDWQPLTLVAGVVGTWVGSATTAGFVPLPSGRGACELSLPNEALSAGTWVIVQLYGAANMADINLEIELDAVGYQDATRFGLAALPTAAAAAVGGLPTVDGNNRIAGIQGVKNTLDDLNDLPMQAFWEYPERTLTQTAAEIAEAVAGSKLLIHRGDTWTATLTGLPAIPEDYDALVFSVKKRPESESDAQAMIRIRAGTGLERLNRAAASADQGELVRLTANSVQIKLEPAATAVLEATQGNDWTYDLQYIQGRQVTTLSQDSLAVAVDVTQEVAV